MLSLILPTRNEAENLPKILEELRKALGGVPYEVIVVDDDSPDRTWEVAKSFGGNVRVLRRIGRRGLASAVVEGFSVASGEILAVMDADFQHDPALLLTMVTKLKQGADLVLASRYREGASVSDFRKLRLLMSRVATLLARFLVPPGVTDPLSGYFAIRREVWDRVRPHLRPRGFKILLEVLAFLPKESHISEIPLHFGVRRLGKSKLRMAVHGAFMLQLFSLFLRSLRGSFLVFVAVSVVLLMLLFPGAWNLRLLYLDSDLRVRVERELRQLEAEEGWLLSDVLLQEVQRDSITFLHRQHLRGPDLTACYVLDLHTSKLSPCPTPSE